MKKGLVQLVFILDRSGSMSGLEADTVGGFNSMLERQKNLEGEAVVTTVLFDDRYELLHDRIDIRGVAPLSEKEYYVRGSTALLDAVGRTISKIGNAEKNTSDDMRAEKVLFVITTDGCENASREYTFERVRSMIERQKERYGWEFIFLGANIDAVETGARFGIAPDRTVNFHADSKGVALNYASVCEAVCELRGDGSITGAWRKDIDEDYESRKRK